MDKKERILVVDDDPDFRDMMSRMLHAHGYEVDTVSSCWDATVAMRNAAYNLVLLDIMMLGIDGVATIRQLKDVQPDVPIVMVTAVANEQVHEDALRRGASAVIRKPFNPRELLNITSEIMSQKPPAD